MSLTDEQFEVIGDVIAPIFQRLERWVIKDIARRIKKVGRMTATAHIQATALRLLGYSPARVQREVNKLLNADREYQAALAREANEYKRGLRQRVRDALGEADDAVQTIMPQVADYIGQQNEAAAQEIGAVDVEASATDTARLKQIVDAAVANAEDDLKNLSKTTAFKVGGANTPTARVFQRAVDEVLMQVVTNTTTIDEAVKRVVGDLAAGGMRTVTYTESGRKIVTQTDVAARRCIQTASARLAGEKTMADCKRLGVNHVEVSQHWGARTDGSGGHADHEAWQGKVYQIDGESVEYPNLEQITGYPSDMLGLLGYNCRHTMSPFWAGISSKNAYQAEPAPVEYNGKTYTYYEATQKMRELERKIRAEKRRDYGERAAGGEGVPKSKIEGMKDEYRDFCKAMSIRPAWNRTTVEGEGADFKRIFEK